MSAVSPVWPRQPTLWILWVLLLVLLLSWATVASFQQCHWLVVLNKFEKVGSPISKKVRFLDQEPMDTVGEVFKKLVDSPIDPREKYMGFPYYLKVNFSCMTKNDEELVRKSHLMGMRPVVLISYKFPVNFYRWKIENLQIQMEAAPLRNAGMCTAEVLCTLNWYAPMPTKNGSVVMSVDVRSNGLGPYIPPKRFYVNMNGYLKRDANGEPIFNIGYEAFAVRGHHFLSSKSRPLWYTVNHSPVLILGGIEDEKAILLSDTNFQDYSLVELSIDSCWVGSYYCPVLNFSATIYDAISTESTLFVRQNQLVYYFTGSYSTLFDISHSSSNWVRVLASECIKKLCPVFVNGNGSEYILALTSGKHEGYIHIGTITDGLVSFRMVPDGWSMCDKLPGSNCSINWATYITDEGNLLLLVETISVQTKFFYLLNFNLATQKLDVLYTLPTFIPEAEDLDFLVLHGTETYTQTVMTPKGLFFNTFNNILYIWGNFILQRNHYRSEYLCLCPMLVIKGICLNVHGGQKKALDTRSWSHASRVHRMSHVLPFWICFEGLKQEAKQAWGQAIHSQGPKLFHLNIWERWRQCHEGSLTHDCVSVLLLAGCEPYLSMVSHSLGLLEVYYVAKDDLELLTLLVPHPLRCGHYWCKTPQQASLTDRVSIYNTASMDPHSWLSSCLTLLVLWKQKQTDLCEFKAGLVYKSKFQDSQGYTERSCLKILPNALYTGMDTHTLAFIRNTVLAGPDGTCLYFLGRGRRISVHLRPAWSMLKFPDQPGLHKESVSQATKNNITLRGLGKCGCIWKEKRREFDQDIVGLDSKPSPGKKKPAGSKDVSLRTAAWPAVLLRGTGSLLSGGLFPTQGHLMVPVLIGCPPGKRLAFDVTYTTLHSRQLNKHYFDCVRSNPEMPCFLFRDLFQPFFLVQDMVTGDSGSFLGSYLLKVVGGGHTIDTIRDYTEDEIYRYNSPLDKTNSLIWKTKVERTTPDKKFYIMSYQSPGIEWLCLENSPCHDIIPTSIFAPEFFLKLLVSNRGVDTSTYCDYQLIFILHLHGLPLSGQRSLFIVIVSTSLLVGLVIFYILFCLLWPHIVKAWVSLRWKLNNIMASESYYTYATSSAAFSVQSPTSSVGTLKNLSQAGSREQDLPEKEVVA
ncbi:cation channel sperm-associated protein subunit gamma isoform X3 [Sigmodon hispidus]